MKKWVFLTLGIISFVSSGVMFILGSTSSHIDELLYFFYLPIFPGILFFILFFVGLSKKPVKKAE